MDRTVSQLYRDYPQDAVSAIGHSLESGLRSRQGQSPIPVFFRADDIGVPSDNFSRMMALFKKKEAPLCLAVVPAWLTPERWTAIAKLCDRGASLWCWHQHGWKHMNHEISGKKNEFGPARSEAHICADVSRGKERLQDIMGPAFSPYFTPPWNRCSPSTINILKDLGFQALSGSRTSEPKPDSLQNIAVNVDLHTRKEPDSLSCLSGLTDEIEQAARSGCIGIMLHHQRMNEQAFTLLDNLLEIISRQPLLGPVTFKEFSLSL